MRIPLFVTASALLCVIALGLAMALRSLSAAYSRRYVREWERAWAALALYALLAASALVLSNIGVPRPLRIAVSLGAILAAWWHLRALDEGLRGLVAAGENAPRWPRRGTAAALLLAALLLFVPAPAGSGFAFALYLSRLVLLGAAWGLGYFAAGALILQRHRHPSALARNALGGNLLAYGALRLLEPGLHLVGPNTVLAQLITYGGIPILVGVGAGMIIALLEVERERALEAAEARLTAERNVTESETTLARREAWFRTMIEQSSDIIFQLTAAGGIEYASPSVERLLGHSAVALAGRDAYRYIHPDDVEMVRDALRRSLEGDASVPTTVPFRAQHADGRYVDLEGVSRPYFDTDGAPRILVAARDVRERRRLEAELLSARRLEAIGRLAGGVAHDFNNLLTAVRGNVALLRESSPSSGEAEHLQEIDQAVERGAELTRRLLAFARQQAVEPRTVSVDALLTDLDRLLRRLLGSEITLDTKCADGLWPIRVDPSAFEQILVNLAVNARDAMPAGGRLSILASNVSIPPSGHDVLRIPGGDWVRVSVRDTGSGIDDAVMGQIFEPFFTTKQERGGTGLGLATVYGATTQAGGHIRVASVLGEGTTFSLYFPRVRADRSTQRRSAVGGLPRATGAEHILLIEDEAPVREVTAKLLAHLGYVVRTAVDGESGVTAAADAEHRLDLVISDLMMPGINGVEAVARIRASRPELPALYISGYSAEVLRRNNAAPAQAPLLQKPFTVEELARAVRQALDGGSARA